MLSALADVVLSCRGLSGDEAVILGSVAAWL